MKIKAIIFVGIILLVACNQKQEQSKSKESMLEHHYATENVMMMAMDESMMAMHQAKQIGNADHDFAAMMIPHHEGAVAMAEAEIKDGKSTDLISFAHQVIKVQTQEIATLKTFLKTASQKPSSDAEEIKQALNISMSPMMEGMQHIKLANNVDQDFISLMIPHHQSAIEMAKAYLPHAKNDQLKNLAKEIIKAQEEEINWLEKQQ